MTALSDCEKLHGLHNCLLNIILSGLAYKDKSDIKANKAKDNASPIEELQSSPVHSYRHCSPFISAPKSLNKKFSIKFCVYSKQRLIV